VEVKAGRSGRDDRLATEGEANSAGLGGNRGIHRRREGDQQFGWRASVEVERKAKQNVADEQASCGGMELNRRRQQLGQDLRNGSQRNVAAAILQQKIRRQFVVLAANLALFFAVLELRFDWASAGSGEFQLVLLAVGLGVDGSQRLQQIDEACVRLA